MKRLEVWLSDNDLAALDKLVLKLGGSRSTVLAAFINERISEPVGVPANHDPVDVMKDVPVLTTINTDSQPNREQDDDIEPEQGTGKSEPDDVSTRDGHLPESDPVNVFELSLDYEPDGVSIGEPVLHSTLAYAESNRVPDDEQKHEPVTISEPAHETVKHEPVAVSTDAATGEPVDEYKPEHAKQNREPVDDLKREQDDVSGTGKGKPVDVPGSTAKSEPDDVIKPILNHVPDDDSLQQNAPCKPGTSGTSNGEPAHDTTVKAIRSDPGIDSEPVDVTLPTEGQIGNKPVHDLKQKRETARKKKRKSRSGPNQEPAHNMEDKPVCEIHQQPDGVLPDSEPAHVTDKQPVNTLKNEDESKPISEPVAGTPTEDEPSLTPINSVPDRVTTADSPNCEQVHDKASNVPVDDSMNNQPKSITIRKYDPAGNLIKCEPVDEAKLSSVVGSRSKLKLKPSSKK